MSSATPRQVHAKARDSHARAASSPQVISDGEAMRQAVLEARRTGKTVGFVPTMGALHDGHIRLVETARTECDIAVVSIYVNPTQFGPQEDYTKYPRDLQHDVGLLARGGCDLVFTPTNETMYPPGHNTFVDVGPLGQALEGEFRPTHFRGVATIVLKLFQLVPADRAYFGRKDYQQSIVIQQMVRDLNVPIEIRVCPTVRDPDGLAMSSRNAYLSADERRRALVISKSLRLAEQLAAAGERNVETIRARMLAEIESVGGINIQYIAFVTDSTVTPVSTIEGPTTIALAAKVGNTRLIDNTLITID
jgi:pantoate--beta-alanine ligase